MVQIPWEPNMPLSWGSQIGAYPHGKRLEKTLWLHDQQNQLNEIITYQQSVLCVIDQRIRALHIERNEALKVLSYFTEMTINHYLQT